MLTSSPAEYGPVRPGEELDFDRIAGYLREQIGDLGELTGAHQFGNGSANLTYLLEFGERRLVLRRPPPGPVAAGAHDMKREYRALSALWRSYDRAPRAWLLCRDHSVAGADFLVMSYRPGVVVWGSLPPGMAGEPGAGRRIGLAVTDALADLHQLDPAAAGVADLGRPDGFVARQLSGWRARWAAVAPGLGIGAGTDLVAALGERLTSLQPRTLRTAILHNDFKIDNCQFAPDSPDRVISVFDWDMATLGDPLIDLGTMLSYWPDPADDPDCPAPHPAGQQHLGLPTRAEVAGRYAAATGADLSALGWYEAFGCWKTAIVVAQLHLRYLQGNSHDLRQGLQGDRILPLARRAQQILDRWERR